MRISLFGFNVTRQDWKSTAQEQEKADGIRINYWKQQHHRLVMENDALLTEQKELVEALARVRLQLMDLNGTPEYTDMADGNRLYYKVQNQEVNA